MCMLITMVGDTHDNNFERVKELCSPLDQGYSALITDLKEKGLLDKTLVVLGTEFGRTPRISARKGRDHHGKAYSSVLAGGGIAKGLVYGKTDAKGGRVVENSCWAKRYQRYDCLCTWH